MSVKCILVFTTCLLIQMCLTSQGQSWAQRTKRDLAAYDKSGPYKIDYEPPYEGDKYLAQIRGFLWQHWKERRLGLVNATFYSIEGVPTFSTSFVEPSAKGHWQISVESESMVSAVKPGKKKPRRDININEYDLIDRVEADRDPQNVSIPDNDIRQPQTYKLRLRNSRTKLEVIL